jgi:trimeric autotransporter adhesin
VAFRIFKRLSELLDVDTTGASVGDALVLDTDGETWVPGAGGGGGGGAPTTVDYLVGTASGDLSAEIVVGTSPGGELGGTWASPTVDATHSGSTHAAVQAAAEATAAAALSAHLTDTGDAHDASAISSVAAGNLSSTDVQAALNELDTEKAAATHAHAGEDITSGTVADARIASTIARDSEVTSAISTSEAGQVRDGDAAGGVLGGTYPNPSFAADMATQAELDAHVNDATDAHDASAISIADAGGDFTATDVEGALDELQADAEADAAALSAHISDSSAAHAASAISADSTTLVGTGTDVQAVLEELDNGIADHIADATAAHAATAIAFTPDGSIAATTVQAAIVEVRDEASGGSVAADNESLILHMAVFA